ncbi:hypothetical protein [Thalassomonas haliotis]|uniref:Tetratricopeptide repeat protein n=1 Tax=Thalassomonas haliotis TaxID=485448 RepID=A0ABY7VJ83_9GAMM|nr:hypothetical protein [Thalassomonas haliotis]WDE13030.1 hypothetical protein H3N35_06125 [Thalassomonas haliotis]
MKAHKASFTKTLFIKVVAATTLLTVLLANSAFTRAQTVHDLDSFKIAVINNSSGSDDILSGKYQEGLEQITEHYRPNTGISYAWEYELGICAANLKMKQLTKAEAACSRAITTMPRQMKRSRQGRYLHSIALSNRAIVRYLSADIAGALADFNKAMTINQNSIVKQNLAVVTNSLAISNHKLTTPAFAASTYGTSTTE